MSNRNFRKKSIISGLGAVPVVGDFKKKRQPSAKMEERYCKTFASFLDDGFAQDAGFFYSHVAHGGFNSSAKIVADQKGMGLKKGVWDYLFFMRDGSRPQHWIEMKHGSNKLTPEQFEFKETVEANGNTSDTCYGAHEAILSLVDHGFLSKGVIFIDSAETGEYMIKKPNGVTWPLFMYDPKSK